jgi:1-aminocyclopropane-1-carboxylate deaminase/D-cysteine desulfhydrase-like pyridoxal-dependent ACC family enzyme
MSNRLLFRYLVPEALEQGCDTLISIGGVQSNHTRQVAGVAAKLGLKVYSKINSYMFANVCIGKTSSRALG